LAICNVIGSMMSRDAQATLYTHAGPEIGVASTKAFTTQLVAMFVLALRRGTSRKQIPLALRTRLDEELSMLPLKMETVLSQEQACRDLAQKLHRSQNALFLGRGIHFPIALEGALKLKEISYIHAEGYPAGEMKHGPNALIDEHIPVVVIATHDPKDERSHIRYEKTVGNIREVQARRGHVIGLAVAGDNVLPSIVDDVIEIPAAHELLLPILEIIPLQLLAYHIAVLRDCDVDRPRNLAKSVTVE
jgi:glucosamine--fructose-6-phosphate aminotransferase (isomerizing)